MNIRVCLPRCSGKVAFCALLCVFLAVPANAQVSSAPVAPVRPVVDEYFGVKLTDRYRYLENLNDPEVQAWFKGQDAYTRSVITQIPGRAGLLARIRELDQSTPAKVDGVSMVPGGRYFYTKALASESVRKLYVRDGLNGPERLLLDPDKYAAPAGSHNAISYFQPSLNGKMIVAGVSPGGSEDAVIHIFDADTGKESPETIDRGWFGQPSWLSDNHSFFYTRMQKLAAGQPVTDRELNSKTYLHAVGTDPEKDVPVFGIGLSTRIDIAPIDQPFVVPTLDGKWAIGLIAHGVLNELTLYRAPLSSAGKPDAPWEKVCDVSDDVTGLAVHGDELYLQTHQDAPRYKVIRTSLTHPDLSHATVVIPESAKVLKNIASAKDALYVQELDGPITRIRRLAYDAGEAREVHLPFDGVAYLTGADERVPGTLITIMSWARGPRIYSYDPDTQRLTDTKLQPLGPDADPSDVVSEEVGAKSWDGVMVPLSIVHRRDLRKDGTNPTLLEGYGSYGITLDPEFDPMLLAWLEKGGVFAVAHVRGGGEYGEDWHKAGQNLASQIHGETSSPAASTW